MRRGGEGREGWELNEFEHMTDFTADVLETRKNIYFSQNFYISQIHSTDKFDFFLKGEVQHKLGIYRPVV